MYPSEPKDPKCQFHVILRLCLVAAALTSTVLEAQTHRKWYGDVQVIVDCSEPSIKDQFTSCLTKELRTLGDVTIADEGTSVIKVLASETKTLEGIPTGFAATIVALQKTSPGIISFLLPYADKNDVEFLKSIFSGAVYVRHTSLATGTLEDIPATAKGIVAAVDASIFQPSRVAWLRTENKHPLPELALPSKVPVRAPVRGASRSR